MEKFKFLPQSRSVANLLEACELVLLTTENGRKRDQLVKSMRAFECYAAPALWSPGDVDTDEELGLTDSEKEEALSRFLEGYELKEADWEAIRYHATNVLSERRRHIYVEYDTSYSGGLYHKVGEHVLIPLSAIENCDNDVKRAFTLVTKLDSIHIVHYDPHVYYNQDGELLRDKQ